MRNYYGLILVHLIMIMVYLSKLLQLCHCKHFNEWGHQYRIASNNYSTSAVDEELALEKGQQQNCITGPYDTKEVPWKISRVSPYLHSISCVATHYKKNMNLP